MLPVRTRTDFNRLICTKVTNYQRVIHGQEERTIYRYAFRAVLDGERYVYSGKYLRIREGELVSLRGTVKAERDKYGFVRLSRVQVIPLSEEPML